MPHIIKDGYLTSLPFKILKAKKQYNIPPDCLSIVRRITIESVRKSCEIARLARINLFKK